MPKKRWTLARLFYARVAAGGGRRILSGPKMAPTAVGGYSQPASCATRALSSLAAAGLVLCAGACVLAAEANAQFTVDVFGTGKGLPSSAVLAVTQTRDGYLWAGTLAGLARFDGVQFEVFDENNTPGLNSSQIIRLYEDRQTNLWIGAENGSISMAKGGKVTSVDIGDGTPAGPLMAVCEDAS